MVQMHYKYWYQKLYDDHNEKNISSLFLSINTSPKVLVNGRTTQKLSFYDNCYVCISISFKEPIKISKYKYQSFPFYLDFPGIP